ncbi:MAG: ribonuclease III [Caldimicrobium sp.]
MENSFGELEKLIEVSFEDKKLLKKALTHSSYRIACKEEDLEDNERLEFIGDAVLNLCISLLLYKKFPTDREGDLTKKRAYLVCKERLIKMAEKLNLIDFVLMGKRERGLELKSKLNIAGRAFEAIIGALFLDQGLEKTYLVVEKLFTPYIKKLRSPKNLQDYKTKLQEIIQKERGVIPHYEVLKIIGPSHKPKIKVALKVGDEVLSQAVGMSKKEAENLAAKKALLKLVKQKREPFIKK